MTNRSAVIIFFLDLLSLVTSFEADFCVIKTAFFSPEHTEEWEEYVHLQSSSQIAHTPDCAQQCRAATM